MEELDFDEPVEIVDPKEKNQEKIDEYASIYWKKEERKGFDPLYEARKLMRERNYFGAMMLELDHADALISGITRNYLM